MTPMTRDELLALPAVVDLKTAARALAIGRTRAFELVRRGEFPVPVLRVGVTYRIPTAPLLELLGISRNAATTTPDQKDEDVSSTCR
jgi:hypothetical protein